MTVLLIFVAALVILLGVLIFRTIVTKPYPLVLAGMPPEPFDQARAAESLSRALQIKTVSCDEYEKTDFEQFEAFRAYLAERFPKVYAHLDVELVNSHALLYKWKGSDDKWKSSDPGRKPILLMAHYDVVPVEESSVGQWARPPFSGEIAEGMIWGRGALDVKCQVTGILDAVEALLTEGFTPSRDVYITFGHDEEVDGQEGAKKTAALLKERGIEFEFILDEGGFIGEGIMSGVNRPMALIGLCEKGYSDVKLSADSKGGHSSMPTKTTALSVVSEGVARLHKNQFPMHLTQPVRWFLEAIAPEMAMPNRLILSNLWLFSGLVMKMLSSLPAANAMFRTTTAATMSGGSPQANVLPQKAWSVLNFRLLSGETKEDLLRHIHKVLKGLEISVEVLCCNEPSKISARDSDAYRMVRDTVTQVFPGVLPTPYILVGATDSVKYEAVSENIFRFSPLRLNSEMMGKMHANDECIPVEGMANMVTFYRQLIRNV